MHENDRRIDYIEFKVRDIAKAKQFYGQLFGWSFQDYGPDYASFDDGRLTGGFTLSEEIKPGGPLIILYVKELEAMLDKVAEAGGTIVKPIFSFPGGRRFHFTDPDGYELAIWSE